MKPASTPHAACRTFLASALCLILTSSAWAALPKNSGERQEAVGQPLSLAVEPPAVTLAGPRAVQQLVVTGRYADGSVRDLTPFCEWGAEARDVVRVGPGGFLTPQHDGTAVLAVKAGGRMAVVPVTVKDFAKPQSVSFPNELIATLNVGGCNAGACHGTPSGKNGFRLSLRGYDPPADYLQLTRDILGRRSDRLDPDASLILQKALARVPHEGGQRFAPTSLPAQVMRQWLSEGLRNDPPGAPAVVRIEIAPGSRVMSAPARWQQLAVRATFTDGRVRDVTRLTVFSSSDAAVADVSNTGLVEFGQSGEVAILCRYLDQLLPVRLTYLEPRPGFRWPNPPEHNYIDTHVFAKLKMLSIPPAELCTDQEFIRRAYMDLCGILPEPAATRTFLASQASDKRARLVDALLRRPEYADFWTLKWSDILRSNRKAIQVKGIHVFQAWLRGHIAADTPFDAVVRELLTANGNTFANPPANYYRIARDPQNLAETTAQLFFGIRMQCAKCHNHPFERWTQDDYYSTAAFFARVRQKKDADTAGPNPQAVGDEIIYVDRGGEVVQPRTGKTMPPKFMGGAVPPIPPGQDRREVFAAWLTRGDNPFFAKSVVNRVWFHLNGRGVVDPVDDFRDSNPSANDALLDALTKDFVQHHFDVKHLIRTVMNSRTYQLSAQTNEFNKDDNKYFSHAVTKLHAAEPLLDAICYATDVPEKFAGLPLGTRAVQLPDGEVNHPFLKTFGQPGRELACECERESDSNLAQALQLINGPTINEKLRKPDNRIGKLLAKKLSDKEILDELYLVLLTRPPSGDEVKATLAYVAKAKDRRKAWEDVLWALLNAKEFLFRH
jgi:hypothetical protein